MSEVSIKPWGVWPVGSYVRDGLAANEWTDEEFEKRLSGISPKLAKARFEAIMHCRDLDELPGTYHALARVFGTSPELWQNLNRAFFDALASGEYYLTRDQPEARS
jgi:hypothetical protein